MSKIKSISTTLAGSLSSIIPMFFTVCKSGVCTVACVSPVASVLGISSAGLIASPITQSLVPLLLVISAVSFTVSYYKLYIIPKYDMVCNTDCDCTPVKNTFQRKLSVSVFWIGLITSLFFFTYFEFQNYKAKTIVSKEQNISFINNTDSTAVGQCCIGNKECE